MNGVLLHHWFSLVEIPACIHEKYLCMKHKTPNICHISCYTQLQQNALHETLALKDITAIS
jgi:hypothetical protein